MRTLEQTIAKMEKGAGQSLRKHLDAVGIHEWTDITRSALYDLKDHLGEAVAASTAKQILSNLRAVMNRVKDEADFPADFAKILAVKGDVTRATYLTPEELRKFETVEVKGAKARLVQVEFLIEAFTGARISDVLEFTEENFAGGYLTYTSKKTKVTATVPVSEKTRGWILYAQEHRAEEPTLMSRNRIIRRIAKMAGIDTPVKTRHGGVEKVTPKWEVLTSHCGRRSCATNLVSAGASLTEAKLCLGHRNTQTTERYLCITKPNLSAQAMRYFL